MNLDEVMAWLYVPANRPDRFAKAQAAADGVVVDLEDAVLPSAREGARASLASLGDLPGSDRSGKPIVVRVNAVDSDDFARDIAAVTPLVLAGVVQAIRLPKIATAADVEVAAAATASWPDARRLICQLESARGIHEAFEVAAHPAVLGVMLGEADLRADLGLPRGTGGDTGLALARQTVVLASRANGLGSPVASSYTDLTDEAGLRANTELMRELGFRGRSCLHPRQVEIVRQVFAPTPADIEWARSVLAAAASAEKQGSGAVALDDGSFVDLAVELQARNILRAARP
jgi:citrate lyase subunit beta/citryl-CoA lyase